MSGIKSSMLRAALPKPFTATKLLLRYPWLVDMGPVFLEEFMGLAKLLAVDTGFERSFREGKCVDLAGNALPWLTYPAIWFLESVDMGGLTVFEYGAGSSSLFWARCGASHVRSVENDPEWVARVKHTNPSADIILETSRQLYPDVILHTDERWDIILVDGVNDPGDRYNCACAALNRIKPGGLIVLDDSNWLPETCAMLQSAGWTEINFEGPAPLNPAFHRTYVFFKGAFSYPRVSRPVVGGSAYPGVPVPGGKL